jgi:hypothetical protein
MSDLRSFIEAAKADGPSAAAKAKVWAGVSSAVGAAAMSGGGAAAGSAGAVKMLLLGTLLGGTLTVGIGATMLFVRGAPLPGPVSGIAAPAPATAPPPAEPLAAPVQGPASRPEVLLGTTVGALTIPVVVAPPAERGAVNVPVAVEVPRRPSALANANRASSAPLAATPVFPAPPAQDDALAREASLLASARNALARRDALTALQIVRGLASLPGRQLIPEELAVEAQALRGLGLADQAQTVDATLRSKFPDSVLGR